MPYIRPINPQSPSEVRIVAERMRLTLIEVLGQERGSEMYTMDWLEARVRYHLDPTQSIGEVLLAVDELGNVAGHTILRVEKDEDGSDFGLFSTIYVAESYRRLGIAQALISHGESWMMDHGLTLGVTYTHPKNERLHRLFGLLGYQSTPINEDFVRLSKSWHD